MYGDKLSDRAVNIKITIPLHPGKPGVTLGEYFHQSSLYLAD
jgi:hypothetical protein